MPEPAHSITRQTIAVAVADAGAARALQPVLTDLNENTFLPVVEKVLDEFGRTGAEIMIDRLALDLGVMSFDGLPSVAAARLDAALRAELNRLLGGSASSPVSGVAILTAEAADLAILEYYLLSGLWPAWSSRPAGLDLDRLVEGMAAVQPVELGELLYRIGTSGGVLERLVAQLDEATLERLVAMLEPAHAALIVGVIAETKAAHKEQPVADMSEEAFADRVWLMTLNYLVAEPGTQFNRREFVRSLLLGMAGEAGADYSEILATFRRALSRVAERRPLHSSLPAILLDLAKEDEATDDARRVTSAWSGGTKRKLDDADAVFWGYGATAAFEPVAHGLSSLHQQSAGQDIAEAARLKVALASALVTFGEPAIEALLRALVPRAMKEGAPFVESLRRYAATAADKGAFYAGVILAALANEPVPFDELARETVASAASIRTGGTPAPGAVIRELRRVLERANRIQPLGESTRATLRAALERMAYGASMGTVSEWRASGAAVLAVLAAVLQSVPAGVWPSRERIDAVFASGIGKRRSLGIAAVVRLLRDSIDTVTPEIVAAMYRGLSVLDRRKLHSARSRAVVRAAIDVIVRQDDVADAGRLAAPRQMTLAAVVALLQTMPPDAVLPTDRVEAVVLAASSALGQRRIDAAFIAKLIRETLTAPISPASIEALERGFEEAGLADEDPSRRGLIRAAVEQLRKEMEAGVDNRHAPSRRRVEGAVRREAAAEFLVSGRLPSHGGAGSGSAWLTDAVFDLLAEVPARAVALVRAGALRRRTVAAWSRRLTPPLLARLMAIIEPRRHKLLIETVERLGALLTDELSTAGKTAYRTRDRWAFVLSYAARHVGKAWQPHDVSAAFMRREVASRLAQTAAFEKRIAETPGDALAHKPVDDETGLPPVPTAWTATALSSLLRGNTPESRRQALALLRAGLIDKSRREGLAHALTGEDFKAALKLLEPRRHRLMRDVGAWLFPALAVADKRAAELLGGASASQRFLFGFVADHRGRHWSAETLVRSFFQRIAIPHARRLGAAAGGVFLQALATHIDGQAGAAGIRIVAQAIVSDRASREAMAAALPSAQFESTLRALDPRRHKLLRDRGALLFSALAAVDKDALIRVGGASALQRFLFGFAAAQRGKSWPADAPILMFFREVAAVHARHLGGVAGEAFLQALAETIEVQAGLAGLRGMAQAMRRLRPSLIASAMKLKPEAFDGPETVEDVSSDVALKPRAGGPVRPRADDRKAVRAPIYIDNAGLVLAGPFIPHLFRSLGMLEQTESGGVKLAARDAATRAVHLLQYLVTSRAATPEPLLVLNKILAGIPLGAVVGAGIEMTEEETGLCDKLLNSMLANWPALSTGTSIAGLQSTFMQREGRLTFEDDKWKLKVERKTLDVLVDQVPWGFRLIYASWMPQPLHVEW